MTMACPLTQERYTRHHSTSEDFIRLHSSGDEGKKYNSNTHSKRKRTYKVQEQTQQLTPIFSIPDTPWKTKAYKPDIIGLHQEIIDFAKWMQPTREEQMLRSCVVERIKRVVHLLWPTARVEIFGSFKTGLYLPTSDIDMVIFGEWQAPPLRTLERKLIEHCIADPSNVKVLDKASVPIVKLVDIMTRIKIDISFNTNNCLKSADKINELLRKYPCLDKLVLVLKQFLLQRHLNEVFVGGLGSYCLTLMVVALLQNHPRHLRNLEEENLGVLLIEFFELFGVTFNYSNTGIRIHNGGSFFNKNDISDMKGSMLCIEDPCQPGNDIARASYGIFMVREAFKRAYRWLSTAVVAPITHCVYPLTDSILGTVVQVDKGIVEYREWVKANWHHLEKRLPHPENYDHDGYCSAPGHSDNKSHTVYLSDKMIQTEAWVDTPLEEEMSDISTDQGPEVSSDDCDVMTDDCLSSDSSLSVSGR